MSLHQAVNLPGSPAPKGYSDAMLSATPGRLLVLGGHVAYDAERRLICKNDLVGQMRQTLRNLKATLGAGGATPEHLLRLTIYTTDVALYRASLRPLGEIWRQELGCVYPALTLLGVAALFDEGALLEIDGLALLPH